MKPEKSVTAYKTWDTVLKCNIFGYPTPEVKWTKSHEKLPVGRHVISGNTLTIKNMTEEDTGVYTCWGTQQLDRDDYFSPVSITIEVEDVVNPHIVSSPASEIQVKSIGDSVNLACSAEGSPLPDGKWFKNGRLLAPTAIRQVKDRTNIEFVIDQFKPRDSGVYTCLFYNEKNWTAEASTNLTIVNCGDPGAPSNGQRLGSSYWTGESVTFICHPGYRLIGPVVRRCLPSGNWSGVQPSCIFGNTTQRSHLL